MPRRKGKKRAGEEYLLLYHLSRTGIIPRTDLSLCRGNPRDRYAQQIIAKHIQEGHIIVFRYKKCDYSFLSDSGVEYLRKQERDVFNHNHLLDEYEKFLLENPQNPIVKQALAHQIQADQTNPKRINIPTSADSLLWKPGERKFTKPMNPQRRLKLERLEDGIYVEKLKSEIRHGGAKNLLYSAGVLVYEEDKPDYETFLSILSHPSYADTFLWSALCTYGVFYSREEIVSVKTEVSFSKRIQGVLFTKAGWYAVFNTLNRFIKWYSKLEADGLKALAEQLAPLWPYRNIKPRSLVFAVGHGMVASMVNGYKYGRDKSGDHPSFIAKRLSRKLMTMSEMNVLYETVYLVELNSGGVISLEWLVKSDEKSITAEYQALIAGNPGRFKLMPTMSGQPVVMDIATGRETIIIQAYDLTMLKRLKNGNRVVNIIGPPWMADATSKSIGPSMGTYISLYGEGEVQVNRYDKHGEKLVKQTH